MVVDLDVVLVVVGLGGSERGEIGKRSVGLSGRIQLLYLQCGRAQTRCRNPILREGFPYKDLTAVRVQNGSGCQRIEDLVLEYRTTQRVAADLRAENPREIPAPELRDRDGEVSERLRAALSRELHIKEEEGLVLSNGTADRAAELIATQDGASVGEEFSRIMLVVS